MYIEEKIKEIRSKRSYKICEICRKRTKTDWSNAGEYEIVTACLLTFPSHTDIKEALDNEKCPLGCAIKEALLRYYTQSVTPADVVKAEHTVTERAH